MNIEYQYAVQDELNFDHEDSLSHWASLLADKWTPVIDGVHNRDSAEWEHHYESYFDYLESGDYNDILEP